MTPLAYDSALLMPDAFAHNARIHADRIAVVCDEERITWREADERTNRFANLLKGRGLGTGDKVALFMPASLDAWIAFWGAVKAGCVAVPLNVLLDPSSLARLAANSDAVVLVADTGTEAVLNGIRDRLPAVQHWVSFGAGAGWSDARAELAASSPEPCGIRVRTDDIITILYTSGSTGEPKGIEHTHASRMAYPYGFGIGIKVDRYSVAVLGTPPYASGTWITMAPIMYTGGTLVILRQFSAEAWLTAVERERATHAFLVPTQFIAVLQHEKLSSVDVSSLRALVTAGQPMAAKTYDALVAAFPAAGIYEVYGFTEGFATLRTPEDAARGKRESVGTSVFLDDIRILDDNLVELPRGETGEIVAHALMMMTGYYKNPARTEETTWVAPDGRTFMRTGDVGRIDADGFVYVSGRLKDMIKSGGMNIYATDIETVFMKHPDVSECAAIGEPHPTWGETPVLVVLLRPGAAADAEALAAWGNGQLAKYQRVNRVEIRTELPRAVYGKIAKHELRAEFARKGL
ncbi:class I adenylate-forming enzyme family protein [Sporichthya sp.]|uniref:class I adenylate-forming enzyme family protein n=1 Tax=Sporichthya sp. TaxID=65475 RepID=UPI00179EA377|nr:AMP-binding protein [Sporichthya sp.]MBA3742803.1 AMP-binding protein [Sporichthya sp.]